MNTIAILWPTFALFALIFVVWVTLIYNRMRHIGRTPPRRGDLADGLSSAEYFHPVQMPADNLANLFEMPVLFFALVPLLMITHHAGHVQVVLAWVFVILRAVHSFIHIGPKKIRPRFMIYLLSCAVLSAMWIGFFVDMLGAASMLAGT